MLEAVLVGSTPAQDSDEEEQETPSGHKVYPGAHTRVDGVTVDAGLNEDGQTDEEGMKKALEPVPHF